MTKGTFASFDGVPIGYETSGQGTPLVLVHGWACDRRVWDAQVPHFARTRRVVTIDLAGHGESGAGRADWTMGAFGEDVRAVVDALGLDQVVLVGHSMGGPVILEAAIRLPGRIAALVPVDSLQNVEPRTQPGDEEQFVQPFRADFAASARRFVARLFRPGTDPALVEQIAAGAAAFPAEAGTGILRHSWFYDARPALRQLTMPIRAINGDLFRTNIEAARRYAPQFDVAFITGVGHYPMIEQPDRFNALLEQAVR